MSHEHANLRLEAVGGDEVVLAARGIVKRFPGVCALDHVDLTLRRGRVTALLGENGAGKSTLMNILAGVFPPDAGSVALDGQDVHFTRPHEARAHGIATIHQELSIIPNLSVAENIFLGREPRTLLGWVDYAAMGREARRLLERVELHVAPDATAGSLRVGQQQLVEIARALSVSAQVLILDEPTSALSDREVNVLFALLRDLKAAGVAMVYITHKLEELADVCDDVVVLRDGRNVGAGGVAEFSRDDLVRLMVGREVRAPSTRSGREAGDEVFRVDHVSLQDRENPGKRVVDDICFSVHRGEILGVFGLMGAGRTEMLEALYGVHGEDAAGQVAVAGRIVQIRSPADAVRSGIAFAPEDRKRDGLVLPMSVHENAALASDARHQRLGLLREASERAMLAPLFERFRVRCASPRQPILELSGGNQQKVILAKWLATDPKVLLLDEPTRGIDINAKQEIYGLVHELAGRGLAVVVVSSELPEVLALSDRILVMCGGRKTAEFAREAATPEVVLRAALPRAA